jgi:ribose transport system permease protein
VRLLTFALSGTAAGLAGVIDTSRVLSALAERHRACVHRPRGDRRRRHEHPRRRGRRLAHRFGVLFVALIGNGYLLLQFDPLYEQITMGALLLAAVGLDALSRRRR